MSVPLLLPETAHVSAAIGGYVIGGYVIGTGRAVPSVAAVVALISVVLGAIAVRSAARPGAAGDGPGPWSPWCRG